MNNPMRIGVLSKPQNNPLPENDLGNDCHPVVSSHFEGSGLGLCCGSLIPSPLSAAIFNGAGRTSEVGWGHD